MIGLLARPASEVTCLPKEVPGRVKYNLRDDDAISTLK